MVKKTLKLIGINILVLFILIICIDLTVIFIYEGKRIIQIIVSNNQHDPETDVRGLLPNYDTLDWGVKHFQEFHQLRTDYESYIGWRRLPFIGETISIDSNGMRYTPQSEFVDEDSQIVTFIGGSTMWGTGSDDENTIPALFSEISRGKYKTINMAETGYRAFQEFLFYQLQVYKGHESDIVVSYSGANELFGFRPELGPMSHSREYQIRTVMNGQDAIKSTSLTLKNYLFEPISAFIYKIKQRAKPDEEEIFIFDLDDERIEQVAKALLDSWLSIKDLTEKEGAIFFAVLQPVVTTGNPRLDHLKLDKDFIEPYYYLYPMVKKLIITDEYKKLSECFIDLSDLINNSNDYIFVDWCHVSPNGNKIIAQKLYDTINSIQIIQSMED